MLHCCDLGSKKRTDTASRRPEARSKRCSLMLPRPPSILRCTVVPSNSSQDVDPFSRSRSLMMIMPSANEEIKIGSSILLLCARLGHGVPPLSGCGWSQRFRCHLLVGAYPTYDTIVIGWLSYKGHFLQN